MKKYRLVIFTMMFALLVAITGVSAANYSKTKTTNVSYGTQCTGKITDKATVNSSSLDWTFSLSGSTVLSSNGYTFAKPYTSSVTYTNARKKAAHKVGYYFYNSSGNNVGGNITTINFTYNGSNAVN